MLAPAPETRLGRLAKGCPCVLGSVPSYIRDFSTGKYLFISPRGRVRWEFALSKPLGGRWQGRQDHTQKPGAKEECGEREAGPAERETKKCSNNTSDFFLETLCIVMAQKSCANVFCHGRFCYGRQCVTWCLNF